MDGGIDNKHQNTETKRLAGNSMSDFLWIKIMEPDRKSPLGNKFGNSRELSNE